MRTHLPFTAMFCISLAACGGAPEGTCVVAGMSALGNAGIYPSSKVGEITPLQCETVAKAIKYQGCSLDVIDFVLDNPEAALRMFVPADISLTEADLANARKPMAAVKNACGW